ncbi:hypothetical protein HGA64_03795, partial [Candidatus Falkowbacteria bacterium]|nr:hypothetical protein [Candidatus Falkowbacteria bacterium]
MEENQNIDTPEFSWQVPEYEKHERDKRWYILASIAAVLMLFYAFWTHNFLFAGIIILASFVMVVN